MNKTLLSILAVIGILAGCAGNPAASGSVGTVKITGCTVPPDEPCGGTGNNPKVVLDLDAWTVTPQCVTAKKGEDISVRIDSSKSIEKDTVWVFPKELDNLFWLAKSNNPSKNQIKIKVKHKKPKGDDFPEGTYRYAIWYDGKCIDPRVRVKN